MPLNIGSGEAKPYIGFKASQNKWVMSTPNGNVEFDMDHPALFDMQNLVMGWLKIDHMGRDWHPWPDVNTKTQQPSEEHRYGFQIDVTSNKMFGDEPVRQYSENTYGNLKFIEILYNACENNDEFKAGKNPLVKITATPQIKIGKGNTRVPEFEIVGWKGGDDVVQSAPQPKAEPKPAPAPEPAPAADDDEF